MVETDIIIIGAGPVGLFTVFEAGLLKLRCHIIDVLPQTGGQLTEIYPKKPIYDIPGFPSILAGDLIDNLMEQIAPFKPGFTLGEKAVSIEETSDNKFIVTTENGTQHIAPNIAIAGGLGVFEPRKPPIANISQFENKGITPASREKLLNFLAGEALTTQDPEQSPSKNTPNTDLVWRVLCVIDSTIREPRNFTQLCDLEKNLKNLEENLHKLNAAKHNTTAPHVSPPASNELLTLTSEILDTLEELQANTTEGKRLGLPERLQAHRKERQHERTSHNWYIGSPAWLHSSSTNSNDS